MDRKTEKPMVVPKAEPDALGAAPLGSVGDEWQGGSVKGEDGYLKGEEEEEDEEDANNEDEDEDEDEAEDKLVEDPSEDILGDLDTALLRKTSFQGTYSFYRGYPDAPNPMLKLTGPGTIGLPLSNRDADAIKASSQQAPFGKGEHTIVDKSVRDTWEMNASNVQFRNAAWDRWITKTVQEICATLGVNWAASQPRAELYKLLLYETHQEWDIAPSALYGTIRSHGDEGDRPTFLSLDSREAP